jgi:site-specific DNA-methyltransferase (adenine-specific)
VSAPYYADDLVTLHHGDCLDVLRALPDASVDAVVTDPPYGLVFMGKAWDDHIDNARFGAWCLLWATECLRVLKPGGHLLTFGGSRTWHRLAVAVEDAGFEIRDSIAWLYGSGFPKSLDVSKAIDKAAGAEREVVGRYQPPAMEKPWNLNNAIDERDVKVFASSRNNLDITAPATEAAQQWQGWGTALKPAFEPIVVGRKPLTGTVAANILQHGTGALNIDGCRIHTGERDDQHRHRVGGFSASEVYGIGEHAMREQTPGRWPTNVVLDESQAAELDKQTGVLTSGGGDKGSKSSSPGSANGTLHGNWANNRRTNHTPNSGGASRFFPVFKYQAKAPTKERPKVDGIAHPTVKPLDLIRFLVRLVTPPGGTVLEPFAGSGTTAEACVLEGVQCIAIEREADYLPLIVARLTKHTQAALDFGGAA